jgi:hypothetical protein
VIRFYFPIFALTAIMSMVACSGRDPVAEEANNAATTPAQEDAVRPEVNSLVPANEGGTSANESSAQSTVSRSIPAAMHGRWALTPADCTSTRGDAKGLLIVSADQLKFYESVGRPAGELKTSPDSATGDFAFTGEGMSWKKYEALELQSGKLVRTESDPMTSFTYARCTS